MLIVTANWGFTDGTVVAEARRARAGRAWLRGVRHAVVRSGFRRDGGYRPPDGLDIVFAGDTFDCLTSTAWRGESRPWRGGARVVEARRRVLAGCARHAVPLLAGLATLVRRGLRVPAADRRGRPSAATSVAVPVRLTVLPGDRDQPVVDAVAEIGDHGATVTPWWNDGRVFVAHGHEFDPVCQAYPSSAADRPPTLAESIATDLVVPFAVALAGTVSARPVAAPLLAALAGCGIADIPTVMGGWIDADGPAGASHDPARADVVTAWRRAVDSWLREARRTPPESGLPASPVESLAAWFHAMGRRSPPPATAGLFGRAVLPAAMAVRTVVLGHPASAAGSAVAVCLGRPPVRRCGPVAVVRADGAAEASCVVANPPPVAPPTIIAFSETAGRPEWSWITDVDVAVHMGAAAVPVVDAA